MVIRDETEQKTKLNFIITDLLCIMMLIVTSSTAWYANVLKLSDRDLQTYCTLLKSFKNAGKIFSATSSQTYLNQKT